MRRIPRFSGYVQQEGDDAGTTEPQPCEPPVLPTLSLLNIARCRAVTPRGPKGRGPGPVARGPSASEMALEAVGLRQYLAATPDGDRTPP